MTAKAFEIAIELVKASASNPNFNPLDAEQWESLVANAKLAAEKIDESRRDGSHKQAMRIG